MIIHQINLCLVNKYDGNQFDTDLMSGFEQLEFAWYPNVSGPSARNNFANTRRSLGLTLVIHTMP